MSEFKPAFPCLDDTGNGAGLSLRDPGMSLRDYFAGKAMQSMVADPGDFGWTYEAFDGIADAAYSMADAMLKARQQ